MVLVQNKIDLIAQSEIDQLEAERLAAESGMRLYRTSVKDDLNVGSVFQHLAENYVNKVKSFDVSDSPYHSLQIGQSHHHHQNNNHQHRHNNTNHHQQQRTVSGRQYSGLRKTTLDGTTATDYSGRISLTPGRRRFSNYACDPCTDYLNNPMFDSLQHRSRYWTTDKNITLRPFSNKKHSYKAINVKSACKVL